MTSNTSGVGHRQRLRQRFLAESDAFTDAQLLELFLTYAIPRQDVVPIASRLLETFGSLEKLFAAPHEEITRLDGVGEAAAILLETVHQLQRRLNVGEPLATAPVQEEKLPMDIQQQELFPLSQEVGSEQTTSPKPPPPPPTKADIRSYTNDLIKVALTHLPAVVECDGFSGFSAHLEQNLPYNSANTRNRYTRYLTNRYYPGGSIATPLTKLLSFSPDMATWKAVLFYETARAEPAVQFTAEQVIWPVLPTGGAINNRVISDHFMRARLAG